MKIDNFIIPSAAAKTPEQYLAELDRHLPTYLRLIVKLNNEVEELKAKVRKLENRR